MTLTSTTTICELLDSPQVCGQSIVDLFQKAGADEYNWRRMEGDGGHTDWVEIVIHGQNGRWSGGAAPTLNIAGSLGGIGGRPAITGIVSDADGALVALAAAYKLARMKAVGDNIDGDVVVRTTICPNAPTMPHHPVPFMSSYVDFIKMKAAIVDPSADGLLVVETSRGNRVINCQGFAITPTVKEGWILPVSNDALDIMERVTGYPPKTIPLAMQDITPLNNGLFHLNGMCDMPAGVKLAGFGVGLTSPMPIAGSAPGVTCVYNIEPAVRFCVEVAKDFGRGNFSFYDKEEFAQLVEMYGDMSKLFTYKENMD